MSKPLIHAKNSVRKFGGKPEDYLPIHNFMDSSKGVLADWRHRALTHNAWFLSVVLEKVFGVWIVNSDGKEISVRDIGEQHCLEDFGGLIPTAQDFLQEMELKDWMGGKGKPDSQRKTERKRTVRTESLDNTTFD